MATASATVVSDNSSYANFKSWATAISGAFATFGWIQSNDTGQVVWTATVLTLTQVAVSGSNAVYSYSSYTGPAPRVGMSVTFSGFTNGTNNVTANLTAVSGGASGTVTVTKVSQVNETNAGSGTTTAQAAVPSGYVSEIWYANDAQAATLPIYIKIGYGLNTSTVSIQWTIGTGSNGSGTIANIFSGFNALSNNIGNAGATAYSCYFSGDAGEFRMALWVTQGGTSPVIFSIERSKDSSGAKTTDYFTAIAVGNAIGHRQQTCTGISTTVTYENAPICVTCGSANRATAFNAGTVAAFPVFPLLGFIGNPFLGLMTCIATDVADNTTVTVASMYGSTHTYVAVKGGTIIYITLFSAARNSGNNSAVLVRYE